MQQKVAKVLLEATDIPEDTSVYLGFLSTTGQVLKVL